MLKGKRFWLLLPVLAVGVQVHAPAAFALSPFLVMPDPAVAEQSAAYRYANMSDEEALTELDRRGILYSRVENEKPSTVRTPVRLTGRLHGVYFHSSLPPEERVKSPYEILDARLALALDDFAALLEQHDIDEVVHFSLYRPNGPHPSHGHAASAPKTAPKKNSADPQKISPKISPKISEQSHSIETPPSKNIKTKPVGIHSKGLKENKIKKKEEPGHLKQKSKAAAQTAQKEPEMVQAKTAAPPQKTQKTLKAAPKKTAPAQAEPLKTITPSKPQKARSWAPPGTRHPAGLAIDIGLVHKKDGRWLNVKSHFQGQINAKACPADLSVLTNQDTRDLRAIACEAMDRTLFTYILTPNYDAAHADHYHMEIKPGVRWFLIH